MPVIETIDGLLTLTPLLLTNIHEEYVHVVRGALINLDIDKDPE